MRHRYTRRGAAGLASWLGLPLLFGCRIWETGRLLEGVAK
jgi:hypothetical protein